MQDIIMPYVVPQPWRVLGRVLTRATGAMLPGPKRHAVENAEKKIKQQSCQMS